MRAASSKGPSARTARWMNSLRAMLIKKPTRLEQALSLRDVTLGDGERLQRKRTPTPRPGPSHLRRDWG